MIKPADPSVYSTTGPANQPHSKPKKATGRTGRSHPVQLTIFDYAARIGVMLLPEAS